MSEFTIEGVILQEFLGLFLNIVVFPCTVTKAFDEVKWFGKLLKLVVSSVNLGPRLDEYDFPRTLKSEAPNRL